QLLQRVREMALEAFSNQDLPFEKLVEKLRPKRDLSRSPIYQIMFGVGYAGDDEASLPGLTVTPLKAHRGTAKFDMSIGMREAGDALNAGCEFSTDLFEPDTIKRMFAHLGVLMEGIAANPDQPVGELQLLTESERQQVIAEWNNTTAVFPAAACIHQLIETQVERTPDAVAAVYNGEKLTYRELNARANQLAHHLRRRGIGPEAIVGICLDRSLELAVGLLAILKTGAAYLPLDPAYPKDRLKYMLQDTRTTVVLTQEHFRDSLILSGVTPICLDNDQTELSKESQQDPDAETNSLNPAYVMYTSGSTGAPKGVLVTHRGVVNHNLAAVKLYGLEPEDRVLQFASISFDIAVEELFPSWMIGATVVFRTEDVALSGKQFLRWIEQEGISVMDLPTAYWHEWVQQISRLEEVLPQSLRVVIVGGEKAQSGVFSTWLEVGGDRVRWFNTYGPTETTVIATAYSPKVNLESQSESGDLPIGRPISNTQVYLLDAYLQPVPTSVAGELYIAGEGLARGYLNRPDSTAEKFLPNPFSVEPGRLMYKSGDMARYRPDGEIEFLGRSDDQVKIRGFRVEAGEVEAAMRKHQNVQQVLVVTDELKPGEKRLLAYVVFKEEHEEALNDLRSSLKVQLPAYMVPAEIIAISAMPLTPNGKVDRQLLPAPDAARSESAETVEVPHDLLEQQLKQIFERVLGVNPVGVADSFFELGGHSLLAVRLIEQIEKVVGKPIPLATLIQAPTVEQLARMLRQDGWIPPWRSIVPIQPGGSKPPIFFAHGVGGNVLNFQALARHLGPDQPVYGLQSRGLDGKELPFIRVEDMAAHYIGQIRFVQPEGPYYLGGMSFGGMVAYEMAQQLTRQGQKVSLLVMLDVAGWGYKKTMRRVELLTLTLEVWIRRIRIHLVDLITMSGTERSEYVRAKQKTIKRRIKSRRWQNAYAKELNEGGILTPALRSVKEANFLAGKTYCAKPYLGHLTVFQATDKYLLHSLDTKSTWKHLALGGISVYDVPGGHLTMLDEPNVQVVAQQLKTRLANAGGSTTPDGAHPNFKDQPVKACLANAACSALWCIFQSVV
ncbi:MAG: amino acid adenylation domain-containing protein, partial [Verrucomicrobiota bacterium]